MTLEQRTRPLYKDYSEQVQKEALEIANYWLSNVRIENIRMYCGNNVKTFKNKNRFLLSLCIAIENDKEFDIVEA